MSTEHPVLRLGFVKARGFALSLMRLFGASDERPMRDPAARIIVVHSGRARFLARKTDEILLAGAVVFIPPAVQCRLFEGDELDWTLLRFDPVALGMSKWTLVRTAEFASMFPALSPRQTTRRESPRILRMARKHFDGAAALVGEVRRELTELLPGWRDLALGHFQHLTILLSRQAGQQLRVSQDAAQRVAGAIRFIEKHLAERISLAELAGACSLSERSFYRVFKQATGLSPHTYIKSLRVARAEEILRGSDRPVTEVAFASGFEDSNFFAREFRKATGSTPTDYRRTWQT